MGAHGGSETTLGQFLLDFGFLLGCPEGHFGDRFGACFLKRTFLKLFFSFSDSEKGVKTQPKVIKKGGFLEAVDMAQV